MVVKQKVNTDDAPRISQEDAKKLLDENKAVFVDLRADYIYDMFHLPGAIRLDLKDVVKHASAVPSDKVIVYYCDCVNEETSARAVSLVSKRTNAKPFAFIGRVEEWLDAGYPFERTELVDTEA